MTRNLRIGTVALGTLVAAVMSASRIRGQSDQPLLHDLDAFVGRVMDVGATPGLAVAVVSGSDVLYAKGFGFADRESGRRATADTQFYIASTSKSFMALTAARLSQRGVIDLDMPLSRALPTAAFHPQLQPSTITLRDLLTHTHGIQGGPVDFRSAFSGEFTDALLLDLLKFHGPDPAGRAFAYSNLGYNIFGLVLDARLPEGWKVVVQREVFQPLGMSHTTAWMSKADVQNLAQPYELQPDGPQRVEYLKRDQNMHSAGGDLSTANDLARYLVAHLNAGRVAGRQLLPAEAIALTHRQQAEQNRNDGPFHRFGWSLGWDLATYDGDTLFSRFGAFTGFYSHLSFMPDKRIGVVVLSNGGQAGGEVANAISTYVYDRLIGKSGLTDRADTALKAFAANVARGREAIAGNLAARRSRPQATPLPLEAYAGVYENPAFGRMVWTLEAGRLHVRMGIAHSVVEAFDGPQNEFRVELTGSGMVVAFDVPAGARRPVAVRFANQQFNRVQ